MPYIGDLATSMSGKRCVNWRIIYETYGDDFVDLSQFPDDSWDELSNKCRSVQNLLNTLLFCSRGSNTGLDWALF